MRKVTFLILILSCMLSLNAKSLDLQARDKYVEAKKQFSSRNYEQCTTLLNEAVTLLGKSNLKIQKLLINSLYNEKKYKEALEEIKMYNRLNPNTELIEYKQIAKLQSEITKKLENDSKLYRELANSTNPGDIYKCEEYIRKYPHGEHIDQVHKKLRYLEDSKKYSQIKNSSYASSYITYLKDSPNGNYRQECYNKVLNIYSQELSEDRKEFSKWNEQYGQGKTGIIVAGVLSLGCFTGTLFTEGDVQSICINVGSGLAAVGVFFAIVNRGAPLDRKKRAERNMNETQKKINNFKQKYGKELGFNFKYNPNSNAGLVLLEVKF